MTEKNATPTRILLLRAAQHVLITQGANQLTLEAVAKEAGVSKGGLLYHFPSKEALIEGMIRHYQSQFEQRITDEFHSESSDWHSAYVRASFVSDEHEIAASSALLAAVAVNPAVLDSLREQYQQWQARFEENSRDPVLATLIRLALDGLWVSELLNLAPPSPERREALRTRLLQLTEEMRT